MLVHAGLVREKPDSLPVDERGAVGNEHRDPGAYVTGTATRVLPGRASHASEGDSQ
jgi:hypothetical protein